MAIAATMNGGGSGSGDEDKDGHEHDLVMPGFRFHPTEEELIEFYLRRKVEGKRFNVELITFLDLYRYDPWELPGSVSALAAIGEKEWFFYVPRDRKYRNGDRPNRVTASGYWKATGADRMIRAENNRSIGLKKTLVFYSGKAPKGIRTSWIMNEYRLPQSETERYQKAEISLCRVYKRAGVDDHYHVQARGALTSTKPSSTGGTAIFDGRAVHSSSLHQIKPTAGFHSTIGENISSSVILDKAQRVVLQGAHHQTHTNISSSPLFPRPTALYGSTANSVASLNSTTTSTDEDGTSLHHPKNSTSVAAAAAPVRTCSFLMSATGSSFTAPMADELNRLVNLNQNYTMNQAANQFLQMPNTQQQHLLNLSAGQMPMSLPTIADKLWEWNPLSEVGRGYTGFK